MDEFKSDEFIDWIHRLIKAENLHDFKSLLVSKPDMGRYSDEIQAILMPSQDGQSFFFYKRAVVREIFGVFELIDKFLKKKENLELCEEEVFQLYYICVKKNDIFKVDLEDFIEAMGQAQSETELANILDLTPEIFKDEILELWSNLPAYDADPEYFRAETVKHAKNIIWRLANSTRNYSQNSPDGWRSWLYGIPLLSNALIEPIYKDYWNASCIYENFKDCHSYFDEESFRKDALKRIKAWLSGF